MRVGLVPISAKPYHAGHHALVLKASSENDRVILFVSVSDRNRKGELPISGEDMKKIWLEHLEGIMPSNVEIEYGGSPVRKVFEQIESACEGMSEDVFRVYSDPEDTAQNYTKSSREKYMQPLCRLGQVIFPAEEDPAAYTRGVGMPDISGTKMRELISSGDVEKFSNFLPVGVDARAIFDILKPKVQENLLKDFVGMVLR